MDPHTEGKWLIHGTKYLKGNLLEIPEYPSWEYRSDIKEPDGNRFECKVVNTACSSTMIKVEHRVSEGELQSGYCKYLKENNLRYR